MATFPVVISAGKGEEVNLAAVFGRPDQQGALSRRAEDVSELGGDGPEDNAQPDREDGKTGARFGQKGHIDAGAVCEADSDYV